MKRSLEIVHAFIKSRYFYPIVFAGAVVPAIALAVQIAGGDLGVNPAETLEHTTGENALLLLLVTLCITPIRRITGWNKLQRVRRMLGVWSFAYATVHVSMYVTLDQACVSWASCHLGAIWTDVLKRKFIFVGALAFVILFALAVTSTKGMTRRLGRRWVQLHRLVYVAAIAAIVHFIWGQKSDITEPLQWALWLAALLGIRLYFARRVGKVSA